MTRYEVLAEIRDIIRLQFNDPTLEVTERSVIEDYPDWDSVAHVQIVIASESRLGILFDPEEYSEISNIGELVDRIVQKLQSSQAAQGKASLDESSS